jgi:hypothetical protein
MDLQVTDPPALPAALTSPGKESVWNGYARGSDNSRRWPARRSSDTVLPL